MEFTLPYIYFVSYLIGPWSYSNFAVGLMSEICRTLKKKKKRKKIANNMRSAGIL